MSTTRKNPAPSLTKSRKELANKLKTKQSREDARDIMILKEREGGPYVSFDSFLRKHPDLK